MATISRLHLNGGPKDDEYVTAELGPLEELHVAGMPAGALSLAMTLGCTTDVAPAYRVGVYRGRRADYSGPVPHNLEGYVEADWAGWRA